MKTFSVCFDARMAYASGIGTYIRGVLGEWARNPPESPFNLSLITSKQDPYEGGPWPTYPISASFYSVREQWAVPRAYSQSKASLLHVPHYNIPAASVSHCVVTVHDLIHLKFPQFLPSRLAWLYAQSFFRFWVPRTRAILTVSENTKKDLIELLKVPESKITVSPLGVPSGFRKQPLAMVWPQLKTLSLQEGYFLYVGNLKEFKNVPRLLEAYQLLCKKHPDTPPLVFAGRNFIPGFDQRMKETPGVRWLSEVDQKVLPALYAGAYALVFPSLYEGFGLPVLEAMACGTPVICSNRGSLPEVAGNAALLIDPLSPQEISEAMQRVLQEPGLTERLCQLGLEQSAKFSWKITAQKTLDVYHQVFA